MRRGSRLTRNTTIAKQFRIAGASEKRGVDLLFAITFTNTAVGALGWLLVARTPALLSVIVILHDVLNDYRNTAIGRIEGILGVSQSLVGKSTDLGDLIHSDAIRLHDSSSSIRTIGR